MDNIQIIITSVVAGVGAIAAAATPVVMKIIKIINDTKTNITEAIEKQKETSAEKHQETYKLVQHNCDFQQAKLKEIISDVAAIKVSSTQAEKLINKLEDDIDLAQDEAYVKHNENIILKQKLEEAQDIAYQMSLKQTKKSKKEKKDEEVL